MSIVKTIVLAAVLGLTAGPAAFAQSATTLGGGGDTRANGGAAGAGTAMSPSGTAGANGGAMSGEVGSRASSAAKGNDPTGVNGATNNRY